MNYNDLPFSKRKQAGRKSIDVNEFKAMTQTEADLQRQCEEYLALNKLQFIRLPDAVYKHRSVSPVLQKIIAEYWRGLPDLTVLKPHDDKHCLACCIELKSKSGKLSQGQKNFARKLPTYVCRSFDDFVNIIEKFIE